MPTHFPATSAVDHQHVSCNFSSPPQKKMRREKELICERRRDCNQGGGLPWACRRTPASICARIRFRLEQSMGSNFVGSLGTRQVSHRVETGNLSSCPLMIIRLPTCQRCERARRQPLPAKPYRHTANTEQTRSVCASLLPSFTSKYILFWKNCLCLADLCGPEQKQRLDNHRNLRWRGCHFTLASARK